MKVEVQLNQKDFISFGWFDALRHKKVWRRPALFAAILGAAAVAWQRLRSLKIIHLDCLSKRCSVK